MKNHAQFFCLTVRETDLSVLGVLSGINYSSPKPLENLSTKGEENMSPGTVTEKMRGQRNGKTTLQKRAWFHPIGWQRPGTAQLRKTTKTWTRHREFIHDADGREYEDWKNPSAQAVCFMIRWALFLDNYSSGRIISDEVKGQRNQILSVPDRIRTPTFEGECESEGDTVGWLRDRIVVQKPIPCQQIVWNYLICHPRNCRTGRGW